MTPDTDAVVIGLVAFEAEADPSSIRPGQTFLVDLGLDSLRYLNLIFDVEKKLGVTISDSDAASYITVDDLLVGARQAVELKSAAAAQGSHSGQG